MLDTDGSFIQWAITQGVAVAVLAYVRVRLDGRVSELQRSVDKLTAWLEGHSGASSP
jgi:hypothetical protein